MTWGSPAVALAVLAATALASRLLMARVYAWAVHRLVDVPNERSSHEQPTPRGGGLAILAVSLGAVALYAWSVEGSAELAPLMIGALAIAVVSFIDDVRPLSVVPRLTVQAIAALIAISAYRPFLPGVLHPAIEVPLAMLWVVGLTNAYNFMDGIDGLAGVQAVAGGTAWCGIGMVLGSPFITFCGAAIAGSSIGFLTYNWPPARIFMGDVGSAFLGYTFAVLPLLAARHSAAAATAGVLVMGPFIFDTGFTLVRRLLRREPVFRAHRSHLYQRMVLAGSTHRSVTLAYGAIGGALALVAVIVSAGTRLQLVLACGAAVAACLTQLAMVMRKERRAQHGRTLTRPLA